MTYQKKFLQCTMLASLSLFFTGSALATSIVNLDEVPHNVTLVIAGEERVISLLPYDRWQSNAYPIKVQYDGYQGPALERDGKYAIWKGGTLSLQKKSRTRDSSSF